MHTPPTRRAVAALALSTGAALAACAAPSPPSLGERLPEVDRPRSRRPAHAGPASPRRPGRGRAHKKGKPRQPERRTTPKPVGPPPAVLITELMVDPLLLDDAVGEYVELMSLEPKPRDLRGLALRLPDGREVPAASGVVAPGAVWLVKSRRDRRLRLPNKAGRVELRWGRDAVDVAQWLGRWPWPKRRAGRALCRRGPTSDGAVGRAWAPCRGRLRGVERGSPGVVPTRCAWLRTRGVACPGHVAKGGSAGG